MVKALRQRPFGEFNVVYFDAAKTTPEKLFARLQTARCPQAAREQPAAVEQAGVSLRAGNLLGTPGDLFHVEVVLPPGKTGTAVVAPPAGWGVPGGATSALKAGVNRCDMQSPAGAKPGASQATVSVKLNSGEVLSFPLRLELVSRVK